MMHDQPGDQGLYKREFEHDSCGIGFVADIKGRKSNDIIKRGLEVLERMEHRGAESADNKTGDGSGILMQVPHDFYHQTMNDLPAAGNYGTGLVFLPTDENDAHACRRILESVIEGEGRRVIGWRDIETDRGAIGNIAAAAEPAIKQIFVGSAANDTPASLELRLYIIRKRAEAAVRAAGIPQGGMFYLPSLSTRTIVYKGMLMPHQLKDYYADLRNEAMKSAIALVHSRFSTNTFPSWDLAQPFRLVAHNGEINTIKGNRFWMQARESSFESDIFGDEIAKILPVIEPGKSDSASFDNALEMIVATGRSLPHALMMLIPESWNEMNPIPEDLKYFYEYHATFMEPWDGPASMVFCDGRFVGGTLDRNGLRPSRYVVTTDDLIVMGSEVGVQTFPANKIAYKGRLMPGKLLLVDTHEGRIIPDQEIKSSIAHRQPYAEWVEKHRIDLANIKQPSFVSPAIPDDELHRMHLAFGYSREDVDSIITPMANSGQEPTGSMGTDTPPAVFSDRPQKLFNYFKQVFAQVTNPPIDPIREELVMTLTSFIGGHRNLLSETPEHCHLVKMKNPIITNTEFEILKNMHDNGFKTSTYQTTFDVAAGEDALEKSLDELCRDIENKVDEGYKFIILSDRSIDEHSAPIPSLLACAAVHHHLIRTRKRTRVGLIVRTGEAIEVMHFALLFGYGADAVNPYGAFATIDNLLKKKQLAAAVKIYPEAEKNYVKALEKGLLKVISKMGTSTLRSYRGAQVFEAVGLGRDLVDRYFTGTDSRIGGIGIREVAREVLLKHARAFVQTPTLLESEGVYQYRKYGERHSWNPESIYLLQWSTRSKDYAKFREFSRVVDEETRRPHFIRDLFDFNEGTPIPLDEVEPVEAIYRRFTTGAMSFGSISKEAHETIAMAMNAIGGRSNSGEGGEDPDRFRKLPDGAWTRSAIKQVASGRFGVTSNYLANADELQIKIAQGAKPGEGGQLPGHKVDAIIARTRHSTAGVSLISPPPHHDIYSIEDLAQLIFDLKNANPRARISVKLVSESGVGTVAAGVAKAHADNIVISGFEGGTGASPISSIKHAGLPWEIGLAETHQTLVLNNLRGRVRLQTDGQIKTGRDIVIAGILGAEEFAFGTSTLIVLGCIMMRKCHQNTCPVGVATQDPALRSRFTGRAEHLVNFFTFLAMEVREIMASLGVRTFDELIGNTALLRPRSLEHWKAATVDPRALLHVPDRAKGNHRCCVEDQVHKIDDVLDRRLIEKAKPALEFREQVSARAAIGNTDRAVGAMLSYEISRRYGEAGLPDDTIQCTFEGSAGQSFGAFLAKGVTFRLIGDANDYFGKGLSGGRLVVVPPDESTFEPEENIIIGNTVLYGATGGEAYIRGVSGERFAVRNSGALAVVEGTGDHCAEYMTGGRIVVLGRVGRNFAAGMSGGIAYVLNVDGNFAYFCNMGMVELMPLLDHEDQEFVKSMLANHLSYTKSDLARKILKNWHEYMPRFIKVMPFEYKRALHEQKLAEIEAQIRNVRGENLLEEAF